MFSLPSLVTRLCLWLLVMVWSFNLGLSPALAYDAPELLPDHPTNVIDLGEFLTPAQEQQLDQKLGEFTTTTGWKVRVLTQVDVTPGRAVKNYWGLDDRSVLIVADSRGRNLLNFSVGDEVYPLLSRNFWIELQSRYGNQFYVREQGYDSSILASVNTVLGCLADDGCVVVPGLPPEQWYLTLVSAILGGLVFGFAGHPRREGEVFAWRWALILSPLWGMLLISFGVAPVITRTSDWIPLVRNVAGFVGGSVVAYLIPASKLPVDRVRE